jgi:hypothetical protein
MIPRCLVSRLTDDGKVVSLDGSAALHSPGISFFWFWYPFLLEDQYTSSLSAAGGLGRSKKNRSLHRVALADVAVSYLDITSCTVTVVNTRTCTTPVTVATRCCTRIVRLLQFLVRDACLLFFNISLLFVLVATLRRVDHPSKESL